MSIDMVTQAQPQPENINEANTGSPDVKTPPDAELEVLTLKSEAFESSGILSHEIEIVPVGIEPSPGAINEDVQPEDTISAAEVEAMNQRMRDKNLAIMAENANLLHYQQKGVKLNVPLLDPSGFAVARGDMHHGP